MALSFEANRGQTDPQVKFLARRPHQVIFLTRTEAVLVITKLESAPRRPPVRVRLERKRASTVAVVRMAFVAANPASNVMGEAPLPGTVNYFIGNDPARWRRNVPTYGRVRYRHLYRGIDLVFYGNQGRPEYDFEVAPGADPSRIALRWEGVGSVAVDSHGDLVLRTAAGIVRQPKPLIYQKIGGSRRPVAGGYALRAGGAVGFHIGAYDAARPLVIDPALSYSTYLGGSDYDEGQGIAVDAAGSAYVTGVAGSVDFPIAHAFQASPRGGVDVFVAKLNATGSGLVYSTYLGGSSYDFGRAIAVDSNGNAYITGETASSDFPIPYAFQPRLRGMINAFVAMIDATGSHLVFSSYLGGGSLDGGYGIAVDAAGDAYVTGETASYNFPVTTNAPQSRLAPPVCVPDGCSVSNAFVTKIDMTMFQIVYSTYLGGTGFDRATGVAVDPAGSAYIAGVATSNNFPTTPGVLQPNQRGQFGNAFVTKVNAAGSAFAYSTYLGGTFWDAGQGIAVDRGGSAYVTGYTQSPDFPIANALQPSLVGGAAVFVTKLNTAGSALVYSTYLGGNGDAGFAIAVDAAGNAYVTGSTSSQTFPHVNAVQATLRGTSNAFVTKFNAAGSALLYSTYLGGSGEDNGFAIAVDDYGSAYVTGNTTSTDFPAVNAFQPAWLPGLHQEGSFVAKLDTVLLYTFQGTASGYVQAGGGFTRLPFTLNVTANPDAIVRATQPCAVPSGTCVVYAVPAASARIVAGLVPPQPGGFQAVITSPVGVFVNQTYQTLGLTRMPSGRITSDIMDLQRGAGFATYNLVHALGSVGPFFTTTTSLAQFNCNFGCVMTSSGTLSVVSVSNVTFVAR